ncbi:UNVERIFIED_ORG: hypothetical protein ABRZ91_000919 [Heyndrickxia coagulans]|jgi:hypothetical protein
MFNLNSDFKNAKHLPDKDSTLKFFTEIVNILVFWAAPCKIEERKELQI